MHRSGSPSFVSSWNDRAPGATLGRSLDPIDAREGYPSRDVVVGVNLTVPQTGAATATATAAASSTLSTAVLDAARSRMTASSPPEGAPRAPLWPFVAAAVALFLLAR